MLRSHHHKRTLGVGDESKVPAMHDVLTASDLRFAPPDLSDDILRPFLLERWGVEGEFKRLSGERDQNIRVKTGDGTLYVYKIASPLEDTSLVDFQVQALHHLERTNPNIPVPRMLPAKGGKFFETLQIANGEYAVRLLSWVNGAPVSNFDAPLLDTITQIGALQGQMCEAFTGFEHEAGSHFMPWDILNGLVTSQYLRTNYLKNGLAEKCAAALDRLEMDTLPRMQKLPHQVIHNDAHFGNVICDPDNPTKITGVIDFGDLVCRPIVVDLATSLISVIDHSPTPIAAGVALVEGFEQHLAIPDEQIELLYDAVLARAILTVELLQFRIDETDSDPEIRDVELPDSLIGLDTILEIEPADFLTAIQHRAAGKTSTG